MAANHGSGARVVGFLAWAEVVVPLTFVVVTIPAGSLVFLLFGGIIVIAPPIALGVVGLGIAKGLRVGARAGAAVVWSLVHVGAYGALAVHSLTWDVDQGQEYLIPVTRVVLWLVAAAHLAVPFVIASGASSAPPAPPGRGQGPAYPEVKPSLWPWLVGAVLILAAIALGIPVAGTD